jgi:hypothetical protein
MAILYKKIRTADIPMVIKEMVNSYRFKIRIAALEFF